MEMHSCMLYVEQCRKVGHAKYAAASLGKAKADAVLFMSICRLPECEQLSPEERRRRARCHNGGQNHLGGADVHLATL